MIKFEGNVYITNKSTLKDDSMWFSVKALCEADAKKKIRLRYKNRKNIKIISISLEYATLC